jgi:hypothetical protein
LGSLGDAASDQSSGGSETAELGSHGDAASDQSSGSCSAGLEAGQACNTINNVATAIAPTCTSAPLPTGTGGTIAPGTYVLAAQTYYGGTTGCPTEPISGTLVQSGSCVQQVDVVAGMTITSSVTIAVNGNQMTSTPTCVSLGTSGLTADTTTKTFTATPTALTLFTLNSAVGNPNPDRMEVFVKQ